MDRYEQPVIFGLLNAAPLQLVKHEELGGRQFMHSPTTTSNVQYSDRHQLLRSLLHAGQGVPSKALYGTGCTVRTTRTQGVILLAMNPMTRDLQQSSVH